MSSSDGEEISPAQAYDPAGWVSVGENSSFELRYSSDGDEGSSEDGDSEMPDATLPYLGGDGFAESDEQAVAAASLSLHSVPSNRADSDSDMSGMDSEDARYLMENSQTPIADDDDVVEEDSQGPLFPVGDDDVDYGADGIFARPPPMSDEDLLDDMSQEDSVERTADEEALEGLCGLADKDYKEEEEEEDMVDYRETYTPEHIMAQWRAMVADSGGALRLRELGHSEAALIAQGSRGMAQDAFLDPRAEMQRDSAVYRSSPGAACLPRWMRDLYVAADADSKRTKSRPVSDLVALMDIIADESTCKSVAGRFLADVRSAVAPHALPSDDITPIFRHATRAPQDAAPAHRAIVSVERMIVVGIAEGSRVADAGERARQWKLVSAAFRKLLVRAYLFTSAQARVIYAFPDADATASPLVYLRAVIDRLISTRPLRAWLESREEGGFAFKTDADHWEQWLIDALVDGNGAINEQFLVEVPSAHSMVRALGQLNVHARALRWRTAAEGDNDRGDPNIALLFSNDAIGEVETITVLEDSATLAHTRPLFRELRENMRSVLEMSEVQREAARYWMAKTLGFIPRHIAADYFSPGGFGAAHGLLAVIEQAALAAIQSFVRAEIYERHPSQLDFEALARRYARLAPYMDVAIEQYKTSERRWEDFVVAIMNRHTTDLELIRDARGVEAFFTENRDLFDRQYKEAFGEGTPLSSREVEEAAKMVAFRQRPSLFASSLTALSSQESSIHAPVVASQYGNNATGSFSDIFGDAGVADFDRISADLVDIEYSLGHPLDHGNDLSLGDTNTVATAMDVDGDGTVDVVAETTETDVDGDGTVDVVTQATAMDTDNDGRVDTVITTEMDVGRDGDSDVIMTSVEMDADGDGVADVVAVAVAAPLDGAFSEDAIPSSQEIRAMVEILERAGAGEDAGSARQDLPSAPAVIVQTVFTDMAALAVVERNARRAFGALPLSPPLAASAPVSRRERTQRAPRPPPECASPPSEAATGPSIGDSIALDENRVDDLDARVLAEMGQALAANRELSLEEKQAAEASLAVRRVLESVDRLRAFPALIEQVSAMRAKHDLNGSRTPFNEAAAWATLLGFAVGERYLFYSHAEAGHIIRRLAPDDRALIPTHVEARGMAWVEARSRVAPHSARSSRRPRIVSSATPRGRSRRPPARIVSGRTTGTILSTTDAAKEVDTV